MTKKAKLELAEKVVASISPLSEASCCCSKKVGAHISAAGGVFNVFANNQSVGGKAFACFLKSQRKWTSPPLAEADISKFNEKATELQFDKKLILPHGSYLINLGNPDEELWRKSLDNLVDDLRRCFKLGISLYNFHPGSTVGKCTPKESIKRIAKAINEAHLAVEKVVVVLETMAGQGNVIGSKFEELRDIIEMIEDKSRIGVCIDTCHIFSAGYDIRSRKAYEKTMAAFEEAIGFKYLRGVHLNDSKAEWRSCLDRHENIGKGKIGLNAFRFIMNDPRFDNIPMVLETPASEGQEGDVYKKEIELLYSLIGSEKETQEVSIDLQENLPDSGN
jgi:AP endonuclease-1